MTRSKTSAYSPKLIRKEEKQLSKQAVKEGRIDRQTIIAQSFRYRRELVQNSVKLTDMDYVRPEDVVEDKPKRARQSASPRLNLDPVETKNALGYTLWLGPYKCAEGVVLDETEDLSDDGWEDEVQSLDEDCRPAATVEIAILDIATPAKLKGVAREFEVVQGPRGVIVLEDDGCSDTEEEWEKLYEEKERGPHATYSAVLQGVGG
ncbi:hypothetical protein PC9H_007059 [Pleurotus ostreatus]|uniref:Uncharacterized protein n=1 Tax=Pleurotus ostreatus TaxID=5322 RepID=A0A8H6ZUQ2_PLEOS|nr:uncharacterized protein PC9H_007059 [Pleurotus ostreatus]KAF7427843.1 hypothetical protein PC9H_007059 [Pleurotus ostreatus]KAJ8695841.1 hypothetical protein PTI98_005761 [Pleurotus ostreatus]